MPDEARCVWCHKSGGNIESLRVRVPNVPIFSDAEGDVDVPVHLEHRDETRRYYTRVYRNARVFLWSVLLSIVAPIIFAALGWQPGQAAVIIYFGVILIAFPFANGTTFEIAGIKNTVRYVQIAGAAFILGGSIFLII